MTEYSDPEQEILLDLAWQSIAYGLQHNQRLPIDVDQYQSSLQQHRACFVTLEKAKQLRGCIGTLTARQPLAQEVVVSAYAAAFLDHRFSPVVESEYQDLELHISVLSEASPIEFHNEQDLLDNLRPGIDGVILKYQNHAGTFLPSVWEQLPEPKIFLQHLNQKAGLAADFWSNQTKFFRYTTEMFGSVVAKGSE